MQELTKKDSHEYQAYAQLAANDLARAIGEKLPEPHAPSSRRNSRLPEAA
jgi:hypothetical protein